MPCSAKIELSPYGKSTSTICEKNEPEGAGVVGSTVFAFVFAVEDAVGNVDIMILINYRSATKFTLQKIAKNNK